MRTCTSNFRRSFAIPENRTKYTYDRASNRLTRTNALNSALSESYTYDGLDRLIDANRNGSDLQSWNLDSLGNWAGFTDGATTQTRTANAANEITGISGAWIDPVYDAAGNMTSGPKAGDETSELRFIYDAWNRLVKVTDSSDVTVATYEYDGQNRRVSKTTGGNTDDFYYNEDWQTLEVRRNADVDPLEQYVWDLRYIDALVVRFYDGDTDGMLDTTLYYTNDANMNVTALVDASSGSAAERYSYNSYGEPTYHDESWKNIGASEQSNWVLSTGARHDAETNNYYQRWRYRNWSTNWLTRDPAEDGANVYEYVRSNPTFHVDPVGLTIGAPIGTPYKYRDSREIELDHAGHGVNVLTMSGRVFWDGDCQWLRRFAQNHVNEEVPLPE